MNLRAIGCNVESASLELREKLVFDEVKLQRAFSELSSRFRVEVAILSTCNRVELYLARNELDGPVHSSIIAEYLSEIHSLSVEQIQPCLYEYADQAAVRHLYRVAAGLDSLVLGEGQIAGQVKEAYEIAQKNGSVGPMLHTLFPSASRVSKRVRTETGIALGHVSVASAAVDFVRGVFDRFTDKVVLVIGAGEMAQLTLTHLRELNPALILVINRTPERAEAIAKSFGGQVMHWDQLDEAMVRADIVLSTTGAPEPIMPRRRFNDKVLARRGRRKMVIFDMAVPRDFDARIHDGDLVTLYNVDDLTTVRDQQLAERRRHLTPAEAIVDAEVARFVSDWESSSEWSGDWQIDG